MVERGDLDHAVGQSAQRHRQRGDFGAPVVRVGDHDHVGGQFVLVSGQQSTQRGRPGLLLALDEDRHTHRRLTVERPHRRQMSCDTGLVVGGAPPVEPAIAFGGLERLRVPLAVIAFRLHVVVGVEQHGRGTRRGRMAGDDGRCAALADDADVVETDPREQIGDRTGTAVHLVAARRVGPHRRNADQVFEVGANRRQHGTDAIDDITHGD